LCSTERILTFSTELKIFSNNISKVDNDFNVFDHVEQQLNFKFSTYQKVIE